MIQEILSTQAIFVFLKWFIVIAIWLYLAVCLQHDGVRIRKHPDPTITKLLLRSLHKRNVQIFGLVSIMLIIIAASDISSYMQDQALTETELASQASDEPEATAPSSASAVSTSAPSGEKDRYAVPQNSKVPFSDITEFHEKNSKQQAYIDLLKQRYETWLVTYYYLQKCGKVGTNDLNAILGSMRKDLDGVHADSSVAQNIMIASSGSYKEMYSTIPCDAAHVASTKAGYDSSMKQILKSSASNKPATSNPEKE